MKGCIVNKMRDLIIVGAGNAAREVLQIVKDINKVRLSWNIIGFIADTGVDIPALTNGKFEIIGSINDYHPKENEVFTCAIADPVGRKYVINLLRNRGAEFINVIHPSVMLNDYCTLGEGIVMYPNSSIGPNASVGNYSLIQSSAIAHDVIIGEYSTISSLCGILGGVRIGRLVFIGCGAVLIPNIRIGDGAYIGAGSVVIKNVKDTKKVFGNPAKLID